MLVCQLQKHTTVSNGFFLQPFAPPVQTSGGRRAYRNKKSLRAQILPSKTQRIMESISVSSEVGGAGGVYSYNALKRLDQLWTNICSATTDSVSALTEPPEIVSCSPGLSSLSNSSDKTVDMFDVVVCGGTLGIFVATALCSKGLRVGIVEKNMLKGREQEWNISMKELLELVDVGILKEEDVEQATTVKFNPVDYMRTYLKRSSHHESFEYLSTYDTCGIHTLKAWPISLVKFSLAAALTSSAIFYRTDVDLRARVTFGWKKFLTSAFRKLDTFYYSLYSPAKLIEVMKKRFTSLGGVIFEGYGVASISVYDDAAVLQLAEEIFLSSRLVIDAMGNFSPVVKQIRSGRKPDGVCLVVGTRSRGFKENVTSDVIFCSSTVKKVGDSEVQLFWEAFPAGSGLTDRTTYMFTYVDAQPGCPRLEELLETYWDLMPKYQGVSLDDIDILRVIFGIFPTYRDSPLPAAFNRILQFGDASGIQSPVSFGGFGSLTRHLGRLSTGIYEAIESDFLDSYSLSLLNPYMPNLSASWLFQRAMSAKKHANVSPDFVNDLLYTNFQCMQRLGDPVLRPFLQDVIQFGPLVKTLGLVMLTRPQIIPSIFRQVGAPVLLDWSGHFFMLGYYTFLSTFIDPIISPWLNTFPAKTKYEWKRYVDAWKYGAGLDYKQ
ncbi:hypothetical protein IFM89_004010 [Coptis chinensis]|uniref:Lycopene beta-cyclase n=1 Tax=Coptis chinensis TaxID=261450 RepID=A0A835GWQ7_9MAGN|nr:hypothetical protein IFM89_004010 [Coptis chinensis]